MSASKIGISPAAVVLCGGKSLRMGEDKASVLLGHETLLQRCCRLLSGVAHPVFVVAAPAQQLPELDAATAVITDDFPGEGPLGGLLTGLRQLQNSGMDDDCPVWVASCDAPFVNAAIISAMLSQLGAFDAVCVRHNRQVQPHSAVYRTGVTDILEPLVASGVRRATAVLEQISVKVVDSSILRDIDPDLSFLRNINTTEELQSARALLAQKSSGTPDG